MQRITVLSFFAKPKVLFYTLPWLIVLLVLGTIAQRYIGLYEAERLFFSSFILWIGPIPLPGMMSALAVITIGLVAKLVLKSPWTVRSAGNIITHMGALLLLVGGLLTALTSEEGSIILGQGETKGIVSDYHQREWVILKNGEVVHAIARADLRAGAVIDHPDIPFTLRIDEVCRHCELVGRRFVNEAHRGAAEKVALQSVELRKEDEANQFGVTFTVEGVDYAQDGTYIAFEIMPLQPSVVIGADHYEMVARKAVRPLPFEVRLESFQKFTHPGTDMAQEYESVVTVIDGEVEWQAPIRMNEPLRYKGYTLYQSSFIEAGGQQFSVLAVVKNAGRVFPYISSIVMCLGLLVHLLVRRRG